MNYYADLILKIVLGEQVRALANVRKAKTFYRFEKKNDFDPLFFIRFAEWSVNRRCVYAMHIIGAKLKQEQQRKNKKQKQNQKENWF